MECDFAVRSRAQPMSRLLELPLDLFVSVELAIHNKMDRSVFIRDRLIARSQINDAEPRMTERNAAVARNPLTLPIGPAMMQAPGGALDVRGRYRLASRIHCDDSAHF